MRTRCTKLSVLSSQKTSARAQTRRSKYPGTSGTLATWSGRFEAFSRKPTVTRPSTARRRSSWAPRRSAPNRSPLACALRDSQAPTVPPIGYSIQVMFSLGMRRDCVLSWRKMLIQVPSRIEDRTIEMESITWIMNTLKYISRASIGTETATIFSRTETTKCIFVTTKDWAEWRV